MRSSRMWLVVPVLLAACGGGGEEEEAVPAVVGARTAPAVRQPFVHTLNAMGVVAPRPGTFAALGAPGPTRVAAVFVTPGQRVSRGDSLIEFERAPFVAASAGAESALAAAKEARDRAARLVQAGVAARKDLEQANAELAQAETNAVTARRGLELATLKAPMAGVVTRMNAVVGAPVDANQPLVEVADPSALDAVFNLAPAEAADVRVGQPVLLTSAGGSRDTVGSGTSTSVGFAIDSASRSVAVRAALRSPRRVLRIGETVSGRISVGTGRDAVVIPAQALVPEGEGFKVFVVDSAGIAHVREVEVGGRSEEVAEITSGVEPGEVVVTYGAYGVTDSARITTAP